MRHMSLEDVALVTTVRETIRACALGSVVINIPDIVKVAQAHLSNPRADSGALFKSLAANAQKGKRKQGKTSIRDVILQKAPQGSGGSGVSPHGPAGTGSAANGQPGRPAKAPDDPGYLAPLVPYGSSDTPVVAQGAEIPAERPLPAAAATEDTPADRQAPPLPPKGEPCAAQDSADASRTTETPVAQSVAESTWAAVDARADVSAGNVAYPFGFPSEGGAPMASGTSSVLPVDEALLAEAPESEDEWALPVKKLGVKKGKGKKK
ncbi:hypothetical protein BC834DRAFT_297220 [Gloeopeniophorella convolvens]|nr:hypothetical protein BC834DRAFT_297220 [Gloeopeniophorella convolvens]